MRRPTRREAVFAVLPAALVATGLLWFQDRELMGGPTGGTSTKDSGSGSVHGPMSFTISGEVRGALAPGSMVPVDLSLENPNDFELDVEGITVTVRDVDAPRADTNRPCSVADFAVRQVPGSVVLSLGGKRTQDLSGLGLARGDWPAVGMLNRPINQDGCREAVLTLGYEANGVEVRR